MHQMPLNGLVCTHHCFCYIATEVLSVVTEVMQSFHGKQPAIIILTHLCFHCEMTWLAVCLAWLVLQAVGNDCKCWWKAAHADEELADAQADDGYLYPLEKAFFYVGKPPMLMVYEEQDSVEFLRQGGGVLAASAKTFDLAVRSSDQVGPRRVEAYSSAEASSSQTGRPSSGLFPNQVL